jgi:hypothetical protein
MIPEPYLPPLLPPRLLLPDDWLPDEPDEPDEPDDPDEPEPEEALKEGFSPSEADDSVPLVLPELDPEDFVDFEDPADDDCSLSPSLAAVLCFRWDFLCFLCLLLLLSTLVASWSPVSAAPEAPAAPPAPAASPPSSSPPYCCESSAGS